ncbi:MAG: peptidase U32 family protein [Patescibacteria group bacterium]
MNNKEFELMVPAGSFTSLRVACKAGADAVYFGLDSFTMRSGKKNFSISDIGKIRKVCDSYPRKPKIYLVLNTIVYDEEIDRLESTVKEVSGKVDAVICWDLAVINLCKKYKVPFFISTQASIANTESAKFYKKLGAKRAVLARELDIKQVKEIAENTGLEIEVFVHGAMCVSVSGRCFTSQFLHNRSANRGECFHPCRRSYTVTDDRYGHELKLQNNKVMSAKDLCVLPLMEELKEAGVKAFKIEGRNRDPLYVDTVTRVYREALDTKMTKKRVVELMRELQKVYNRGFSSGFYLGKPTPKDFSEVENSVSEFYRSFLGKIVHLYPKVSVAVLRLSDDLETGEEIAVFHEEIGVERMKVGDMEIENEKVKKAKKGQDVGIKFPFDVHKNTEVYKIKKR